MNIILRHMKVPCILKVMYSQPCCVVTVTDPDAIQGHPPSTSVHPCPSGYWPHRKSCYSLQDTPATWTQARDRCRQDGGDLASIQDESDNALVYLRAQASPVWLGLKVIKQIFTCWLLAHSWLQLHYISLQDYWRFGFWMQEQKAPEKQNSVFFFTSGPCYGMVYLSVISCSPGLHLCLVYFYSLVNAPWTILTFLLCLFVLK